MKVNSKEVKRQLRLVWPDQWKRLIRHTYIFDRFYWLPTRKEVEEFLKVSKVDKMQFFDEIADCDDFALLTHADAKKVRIILYPNIPREEWAPWAFGETAGSKFRGMKMKHMVNICITRDEGVLLLDTSQRDRIWQARADKDNLFFIKM